LCRKLSIFRLVDAPVRGTKKIRCCFQWFDQSVKKLLPQTRRLLAQESEACHGFLADYTGQDRKIDSHLQSLKIILWLLFITVVAQSMPKSDSFCHYDTPRYTMLSSTHNTVLRLLPTDQLFKLSAAFGNQTILRMLRGD
jgi:hypothetical protein